MPRRATAAFLLLASVAHAAAAQDARGSAGQPSATLHGTVRDSASGTPIAGVVVELLDRAGTRLARAVTSDSGIYRLRTPAPAMRVELLRLGFRPQSRPAPAWRSGGVDTLDVVMTALPSLLGSMQVEGNERCSARPDREAAQSLWEQARAGLLSTVVARESNPAQVTRLAYQRSMDVVGARALHQTVRVEAGDALNASFFAVRTATDFVRRGFRADSAGRHTYFSPDADVLLNADFASGYCFQLMSADEGRRNQLGLGFQPVDRRRGRVDIAGSLWIDTTTRALTELAFSYLGVDQTSEGLGAGGRISFRTMPNGVAIIDRWMLRMVGAIEDASPTAGAAPRTFVVREVGGELARAAWSDGTSWRAPLGRARVRLMDALGTGASGIAVGLADTDYRAITDKDGYADFDELTPGPYHVFVVDPQLGALGIVLPTPRQFDAQRGALVLTSVARPTAEQFMTHACAERGFADARNMLLARVVSPGGSAVRDATWRTTRARTGGAPTEGGGNRTEDNGLIFLCDRLALGENVRLDVSGGGRIIASADLRIAQRVTTALLTVRDQLTVAAVRDSTNSGSDAPHGASANSTGGLAGIVRDSISGAPVVDAVVSLRETPHSSRTDSVGRFRFPALEPRDYTMEIRTPWLDSLGTLKRLQVPRERAVGELTVFLPTDAQIATAMCGTTAVSGIVVGRVDWRAISVPPDTLHVIAEWSEAATDASVSSSRRQRIVTRADARGTFRICGVPADTTLTIFVDVGGTPIDASRRADIRVTAARRIARSDLVVP